MDGCRFVQLLLIEPWLGQYYARSPPHGPVRGKGVDWLVCTFAWVCFRALHGRFTDTPRTAHGRPKDVDTPWSPHGHPANRARTAHRRTGGGRRVFEGRLLCPVGYPWNVRSVPMGCPRGVRGVCVKCPWGVRGGRAHEVPMVSPWAARRVGMGCSWGAQVSTGSPCTPGGLSVGRPWGLHGASAGCPWTVRRASVDRPWGGRGVSVVL